MLDILERQVITQLPGQRSHFLVFDTAGYDVIEITEICIDIESKAMHGHPPAASNAHGTDLPLLSGFVWFDPYPGFPRTAFTFYPINGKGLNDHFLQGSQVPADIRITFLEINDGIAYDLPGPMVGYIATPVGVEKRNSARYPVLLADQHMGHITAFPKRIHVFVLAEQQMIHRGQIHGFHLSCSACSGLYTYILAQQFFLQIPGFLIANDPQIPEQYIHSVKINPN